MERKQIDPLIVLIEELNALRAHPLGEDYCSGIDDAISLARSAMYSMHNRWDADGISVKDQWRVVVDDGNIYGPYASLTDAIIVGSSIDSKFKIQTRVTAAVQSDWADME